MLSNDYYYFSTIRKYVSVFGSIFNNLIINRTNANGNVTQIINVPISYGQKEKMMTRLIQDPEINNPTSIILPRMSFFLDGLVYDNQRKRSSLNKLVFPPANTIGINTSNTNATYQYDEVPYNLYFSLFIYFKNNEDGTKIIEQILPFFRPEFTVRAFMIPNKESQDIPIELSQISNQSNENGNFKDFPILIWELKFRVRGSLFGPILETPIIGNTTIMFEFDDVVGNNLSLDITSFGMTSNIYTNTSIYSNTNQFSVSVGVASNIYANGMYDSNLDDVIYTIKDK